MEKWRQILNKKCYSNIYLSACAFMEYLWKGSRNSCLGYLWGGELGSWGTGWEGNFYYIPFCTFHILCIGSLVPIKITAKLLPIKSLNRVKKLLHNRIIASLSKDQTKQLFVVYNDLSFAELSLCVRHCDNSFTHVSFRPCHNLRGLPHIPKGVSGTKRQSNLLKGTQLTSVRARL